MDGFSEAVDTGVNEVNLQGERPLDSLDLVRKLHPRDGSLPRVGIDPVAFGRFEVAHACAFALFSPAHRSWARFPSSLLARSIFALDQRASDFEPAEPDGLAAHVPPMHFPPATPLERVDASDVREGRQEESDFQLLGGG